MRGEKPPPVLKKPQELGPALEKRKRRWSRIAPCECFVMSKERKRNWSRCSSKAWNREKTRRTIRSFGVK